MQGRNFNLCFDLERRELAIFFSRKVLRKRAFKLKPTKLSYLKKAVKNNKFVGIILDTNKTISYKKLVNSLFEDIRLDEDSVEMIMNAIVNSPPSDHPHSDTLH